MPDLITKADIVALASLNSSVEDRKVASGIEDAHRELKKVLGSTGYALVYATPGDYTELVPLLKKWMVWLAKEKAMPDMYAEPDKGGVFVKSGDDYRAVGSRDLALLTNACRDRAEARLEDVIHHLINNPTLYTWYGTSVDGEERIDSTTKNSGGISLRRSEGQNQYRG